MAALRKKGSGSSTTTHRCGGRIARWWRGVFVMQMALAVSCTQGPAGSEQTSSTGSTTDASKGTEDVSTGSEGSDQTGLDTSESTGASSASETGTNAAPQAADDQFYGLQDSGEFVVDAADGVLANDTDADGDALSVVEFDAGSSGGGEVSVDADGGLTYVPAAGFWGLDRFEYTVADLAGQTDSGTVIIAVAPTVIDLDAVAGANGFVLRGEEVNDGAGIAASYAGDVDGDGRGDLVVGATGVGDLVGRAYFVLGSSELADVELGAITACDGGYTLDGVTPSGFLGSSVSGAGDINGDGLADVVVGAPTLGDALEGRAYVVYGGVDDPTVAGLEAGRGGFVVRGEPGQDVRLGHYVSGVGDANGDGLDDIIVGARWREPNFGPGRAYVIFGKPGTSAIDVASLAQDEGFTILPGPDLDRFFRPVAGAGDVNGDGLSDLIVSGPFENGYDGRVYVVLGKSDGATVDLAALADAGFSINPTAGSGGFFGVYVTGIGDFNSDGLDDLATSGSGTGVVVFGKRDTDDIDMTDITDGTAGMLIASVQPNLALGPVGAAGDVNGDGVADLIIGSEGGVEPTVGRAYVVFGTSDRTPIDLSTIAAGQGGFALESAPVAEYPGWVVGTAGDVDGDGLDDVMVGNYRAPDDTYTGRVHIVLSVPRPPR